MTKQRNYNDYKSVWRNKPNEAIRQQIKDFQIWPSFLANRVAKDGLTSGEKIDILNGILWERVE